MSEQRLRIRSLKLPAGLFVLAVWSASLLHLSTGDPYEKGIARKVAFDNMTLRSSHNGRAAPPVQPIQFS